MTQPNPSEKIASLDGKIIKDSLGRTITLRQPDLLDMFDLTGAMGKESENSAQLNMAMNTIYIAKIDSVEVPTAKSYNQVRANLKLIKIEGMQALNEFLETHHFATENEAIGNIKK